MKSLIHLLHTVAMVSCGLLLSVHALSDTPVGPMNYQGRLLDGSGIPVGYPTPTTATFVARVYDAPTGGTLKYQETHANVTVDDGVYSFLVGTAPKDAGDSTWSVELWNCCAAVYLEISVNGQTLTPRHQLAAAPYAFQANLALTTNNALALGGKTATQYNSILADICTSSKGKWLELVGKCLGIGASFPGPNPVNWNTLTASNNFSNLDLSRADISGINFNGADLTATVFTKTTYSAQGMSGANLSYTQWSSAVATDSSAFTLSASTNLSYATFKNMDMSKWNLSAITYLNYTMLSAAYLSSCPAGLPNDYQPWACRLMTSTASNYFLLGPYANFSTTSAASITKFGVSYLDVDSDKFDNINVSYASFTGNTLLQNFVNSSLYFADLSHTSLIHNRFVTTSFAGTKLVGANIEDVIFASDVFMPSLDFSDAQLTYVRFDNAVSGVNFTRSILNQVEFTTLGGPNFTNAILQGVRISTQLYGAAPGTIPTFDGTRFYGGFYIASMNIGDVGTMVFKNLSFTGGILGGDFRGAKFTGTISLRDITFTHLNICGATIPVTGGTAPFPEFATVTWTASSTRCPDNTLLTSCNIAGSNHFATPTTPVGNCVSTIP